MSDWNRSGGGQTASGDRGVSLLLWGLGLVLLLFAPTNNPLQGWGMVLRALAGQALIVAGAHRGARASGAPPRQAARRAWFLSSLVLLPVVGVLFLLSRESGTSWAVACLVLAAWYGLSLWLAAGSSALTPPRRRPPP